VRAMQIISELEGYGRGTYAGIVGYALPDGDLDTCIAIRTLVLHDGVAYLPVNGLPDIDMHIFAIYMPGDAARVRLACG